MTKEEYQYILNKLSSSVYPDGFLCVYKESKICVCLTKAYFKFVVEHLGKLLEDEEVYNDIEKCEREDCPKKKVCAKRKEDKCCENCEESCLREPYVSLDEIEMERDLASAQPNSRYSKYSFKYLRYILAILKYVEHHASDDNIKKNVLLLFINFLNNGDEKISLKNSERLKTFEKGIKEIRKEYPTSDLYKRAFKNLLSEQYVTLSFSQTDFDFDDSVYSVFLKIISDWVNQKVDDKVPEKNMFNFLTEQIMKY